MDQATATKSIFLDTSHELPLPIDLSHHYSKTTKNRNASAVKRFYKYFKIPNIGNLAGGTLPRSLVGFQTKTERLLLHSTILERWQDSAQAYSLFGASLQCLS